MSELAKRVLFAVPAAAFFLFVVWLGGWYLGTLVIVISFFMQYEAGRLFSRAGWPVDRYFPYTAALWVLLIPHLPYPLEIGIGIFLVFLAVQALKGSGGSTRELAATVFASLYAPLGLLFFLLVRMEGGGQAGFVFTLSLLFMVWGNDILAYFGGKNFGKRALAPSVSPNKTWEGFFFGFLGSALGLLIVYFAVPLPYPLSLWAVLPAAVLVGVFGPVGDLIESSLKRAADVKDASGILPGHGGLYDRFDALLLAAPAFYLYLQALKIMGYASF